MKGKMRVIAFTLTLILFITTVVNDTTLLQVSASDATTQTEGTTEEIIDGADEAFVPITDQGDAVAPLDNVTESDTDTTTPTDEDDAESDLGLSAGLDATDEVDGATSDVDGETKEVLDETDAVDGETKEVLDETDAVDGETKEVLDETDAIDGETEEILEPILAQAFEQSIDMGNVIVHIFAQADVFPADTNVTVTPVIGAEAETAQSAVDELLADDVEMVSTMAYDITFSTPELGEIQPNGAVEVTFEAVTKEADEDISVYHMDETLTVATQIAASVEDPDATVTDVAIEANSFSVYVVTITSSSRGIDENTIVLGINDTANIYKIMTENLNLSTSDVSLIKSASTNNPSVATVQYLNGNSGKDSTLTAVGNGTATISISYKKGHRNHTLDFTISVGEKLNVTFDPNGGTGGPAPQLVAYNGKISDGILNTKPTLAGATFDAWKYFAPNDNADGIKDGELVVFNKDTKIKMDTIVYATWNVSSSDTIIPAAADSSTPGEITATKTAKWADENAGIAKITFNVSGIPSTIGADVIFVVDTSYSMYQQVNSYYTSGSINIDRINPAKNATVAAIDQLLANNNAANNRVAFVPFAGSIQNGYTNFQTTGATIKANVLGASASSGTNYYLALQKAKNFIESRSASEMSRPVYIVFISDGMDNRSSESERKSIAATLDSAGVDIYPIGIQLLASELGSMEDIEVNHDYTNIASVSELQPLILELASNFKNAGTKARFEDQLSTHFQYYSDATYVATSGVTNNNGNVTILVGDITDVQKTYSFYAKLKTAPDITSSLPTNSSANLYYTDIANAPQVISDTVLGKPTVEAKAGTVTTNYYLTDDKGRYLDKQGKITQNKSKAFIISTEKIYKIENGGSNYDIAPEFTGVLADYELYKHESTIKNVLLQRTDNLKTVEFKVVKVAKYDLLITADSRSKEYDGLPLTDDDYSTSGLQHGHKIDKSSAITVTGTITNVGFIANKIVLGPIKIVDHFGKDVTKQYRISTSEGKLTVTPAKIEITVDPASKTYGDLDPVFTGGITKGKLFNASDLGTITYSRTNSSIGKEMVWDHIYTTAQYTKNNNYDVKVNSGVLKINKRKITITVDDKTKVYGQWSDPLFTGSITAGSLVSWDSSNRIIYMRDLGDHMKNDVGDNIHITAYIAYESGYFKNYNYDVTVIKGTLTITKKPITITVDSKEKYFGDADPEFTGAITLGEFAYGQKVKISYSRTQETEGLENAGDIIDITATIPARHLKNYELTIITGRLSIIKEPAIGTITGTGFTKIYDGVAQALTPASAADTAESIYNITYSVDGGEFTQTLPEFKYVKTDTLGNVVPYIVTIKATTARYEDVTKTVEVLISKKAITIQAATVTLPDSSLPVSANSAGLSAGTSLATGDVLAAVTVTGTLTAIGSGSNVPSNAIINDGNQADVTNNYAITYVNGLITVYDGTGPAPIPEEVILIPEEATALEAEIPTTVRVVRPVAETIEVETQEVEEVEVPEVIEEEETPLAPEIEEEEEGAVIEDEETPLAVLATTDCWIHWLILALSLLYGAYAVVRTVARAKKISELSEGATDKEASSRI